MNNKLKSLIQEAEDHVDWDGHNARDEFAHIFVALFKESLCKELREWIESDDQVLLIDPHWRGYRSGIIDAIIEVQNFGQDK